MTSGRSDWAGRPAFDHNQCSGCLTADAPIGHFMPPGRDFVRRVRPRVYFEARVSLGARME